MQAIHMTCSLPVLFSPVCVEDKCYIDGGVFCNYPLNYCIESGKSLDEILGIKNKYSSEAPIINADSTIMDFLLGFIYKAVFSVNTDHAQSQLKNEVVCDAKNLSFEVLRSALNSIDVRRELHISGVASATTFLSNLEDSVKKLVERIL
jgi:predicted acylesterase/phospholipase RssA